MSNHGGGRKVETSEQVDNSYLKSCAEYLAICWVVDIRDISALREFAC